MNPVFKAVMETQHAFKGLHNFLQFPECLDKADVNKKKVHCFF